LSIEEGRSSRSAQPKPNQTKPNQTKPNQTVLSAYISSQIARYGNGFATGQPGNVIAGWRDDARRARMRRFCYLPDVSGGAVWSATA